MALLFYAGALCGLVYWSDFTRPGNGVWFGCCGVAAGMTYWWLVVRNVFLHHQAKGGEVIWSDENGRNRPSRAAWRPSFAGWLWSVAIAARLLMFFAAPGDDVWRYLWEGRIQNEGFNPYIAGPTAEQLVPFRDANWPKINHPDWPAIYPPAAELACRFIAPSGVLGFKLFSVAADLGVIYFLLKLLTGPGRFGVAAWYAWNPLIIYSFIGAGHFDSWMVLFLVMAVYSLQRSHPEGDFHVGWGWLSCLFLGLAIAVKLVPVLLVPLWMFALRRHFWLIKSALLVPILLACFYGFPRINIWSSAFAFGNVTRVNDLFWWLWEYVVPNIWQNNRHYSYVLTGAVLLVTWASRKDWRKGIGRVLGVSLLCSPALQPWYLSWVLPFASWQRTTPWVVLSISVFFYFTLTSNSFLGSAWRQPWWHHLLVSAPALVSAAIARRRWVSRAQGKQKVRRGIE